MVIAARLRKILEGKAKLECVESIFVFNRCLRQESVETLRLWQKMATQLISNVEEEWIKKRMALLLDIEDERAHQICRLMWADNFGIMSHSE